MTCKLTALIAAYKSGLLPPAKTRELAGHIETCTACRAALAAHNRLDNAVRVLPVRHAPHNFEFAVMAAIRRQDQAVLRLRRVIAWVELAAAGLTAAAVATVAAGLIYFVSTPQFGALTEAVYSFDVNHALAVARYTCYGYAAGFLAAAKAGLCAVPVAAPAAIVGAAGVLGAAAISGFEKYRLNRSNI